MVCLMINLSNKYSRRKESVMVVTVPETMLLYWCSVPGPRGSFVIMASESVVCWSGNSVAIIVPCHRVIGSNDNLTGYGGGLPTKAWLLSLEGLQVKTR